MSAGRSKEPRKREQAIAALLAEPTHAAAAAKAGIAEATLQRWLKRPGFLRLMTALKPRPSFQVLVMSEESRLGREQIETAYALKSACSSTSRTASARSTPRWTK